MRWWNTPRGDGVTAALGGSGDDGAEGAGLGGADVVEAGVDQRRAGAEADAEGGVGGGERAEDVGDAQGLAGQHGDVHRRGLRVGLAWLEQGDVDRGGVGADVVEVEVGLPRVVGVGGGGDDEVVRTGTSSTEHGDGAGADAGGAVCGGREGPGVDAGRGVVRAGSARIACAEPSPKSQSTGRAAAQWLGGRRRRRRPACRPGRRSGRSPSTITVHGKVMTMSPSLVQVWSSSVTVRIQWKVPSARVGMGRVLLGGVRRAVAEIPVEARRRDRTRRSWWPRRRTRGGSWRAGHRYVRSAAELARGEDGGAVPTGEDAEDAREVGDLRRHHRS